MDVDGFEEGADEFYDLSNRFEAVAMEIEEATRDSAEEVSEEIRDGAKRRAPVGEEDGGDLQESIHIEERDWGFLIGSSLDHAKPTEFGTRHIYGPSNPYEIEPDSAGALSFEVDGERVVVAKVEHPGVPAQPFLRPATDAAERQVKSTLRDHLRDLFSRYF